MSTLETNSIIPRSGNTVAVGGAPTQPSAILQIVATDKGFLLPRLTTSQRDAITAPATSLLIFNLDSGHVERWSGGSWVTAEGIKSINGLVSDAQVFAVGAAGTTPNFASTGSTHTLNIPLASATAVTSGTISKGDYDSFNIRLYPVQNVKYVVKNSILGPQDYNSVADALASISDASASNPYLISIGPGVFTEAQLIMKPFVSIIGVDDSASIVEANNPAIPLIVGSHSSEIKDVQLSGPTNSGVPLIYHTGTAANSNAFSVIDCAFQNAALIYHIENNNSFPTLFRTEGCRISSLSSVESILLVEGSNSSPLFCFFSGFIYRRMVAPYPNHLMDISGSNAKVILDGILVETNSTTSHGIHIEDGSNLAVLNSVLSGLDTGLHVHNVGSAPLIQSSNFSIRNCNQDINVEHPGTMGSLNGASDINKVFVDDLAPITLSMIDPENGGTFDTGPLSLGRKVSFLTNVSDLLEGEPGMGIITGGFLTDEGGFDVGVGDGFGYAQVSPFPDHRIRRIAWPDSTVTLSANQDVYIYVNSSGVLTSSGSIGNTTDIILIGRVVTNATGIELIDQSPMLARHAVNYINRMFRDALGSIYDSGSIVTENVTPFKLNITAGTYFFSFNRYTPSGGSAISFHEYYKDGLGGYNSSTTDLINNTDYDDGTGTLAPLTSGYYVKHTLYVNCDDADEKYFLVLGQAEYAASAAVESAPLPTPPSWIKDAVTPIASIIVQEGSSNIFNILDIRPVIGFKSSGVSASADHGNLLGLADDDHTQYLLVSGTRAMAGNLNMGSNNITNVGQVNGVIVEAHASRHLPSGADPLATAAPVTAVGGNTTNQVGTANSLARSDHQHGVATGTPSAQIPDQANAEGVSNNIARADHTHNIPTAAPTGALGGNSTNQQGIASTFARSDHSHDVDTGVPVAAVPGDSNTEGTSQNLARADHKHAIPVGTPVAVADANAPGAIGSFARSDHVHAHGAQTNPAHHAVATTIANGFLSAADKVRVDNAEQVGNKGAAGGYAPLDGTTKIPIAYLPDTVIGSVDYKGTWNANTNTPNLVLATPDKGDYYVVNVAGSTSLGGITDWKIGDWAIYNGTAWEKVDNTDQVTSVFGRQGAVVAQSGDYTASQITNVPAGNISSTDVQAAINELDAEKAIVTSTPPANVTKAAAAVGVSTEAARADHKHDIATAAPSTLNPDQANAEGTSSSLSRADHIHNVPADTAVGLDTSTLSAEGASSSFARANHTHAISIVNTHIARTATFNITSGTDALVTTLTATPVAGTYLVLISGSADIDAGGSDEAIISIYSGGTQVTGTERHMQNPSGINASTMSASAQAVVTVNGSQAIEFRARQSGGTQDLFHATLTILKLSN